MAQTTASMSPCAAKVEMSFDGAAWVDISGHSAQVSPSPQTRMTGTAYTFDGDTAIIKSGKREPVEVEVKIIYTEVDADAFDQVRARFEVDCGEDTYIRWSPAGGNAGDQEYSTGCAIVNSFEWPGVEAASADPIPVSFKVTTGEIDTEVVAS